LDNFKTKFQKIFISEKADIISYLRNNPSLRDDLGLNLGQLSTDLDNLILNTNSRIYSFLKMK
jgi:hypothetical protein